MDFSNIKTITIPEGIVQKIVSAGVTLWQAVTYKNWVKYSTEADGETIYNGGLGYKDGFRIRSGGAEGADTKATCTGFIPFNKGDVLRIHPKFTGENTINTINFADGNFNNIGQMNDSGSAYGICASNKSVYKTAEIDGVSTLTYTDSFDQSISLLITASYKY